MKVCLKCGAQNQDDAIVCSACNRVIYSQSANVAAKPITQPAQSVHPSALSVVALVFMIIGTVAMTFCTFGIGLAWCLPMTISYGRNRKNGIPVSIGFKVCSLIFVNTIAGILMLCDRSTSI